MAQSMDKSYNAPAAEQEVARKWEAANAFHAEPGTGGKPYSIVIPPPNVTAALHMGHALNNTLQDILIRWRRMCGDNAMWMPGTDHAGIATQTVVEKRVLAEEGKRRTDFQREEFVAKIQAWKDEYEATITGQLKAMGCSCDWQRQRFTMDEVCAAAVREAFFRLFKEGLIYRGKRLVNWDPVTQTALADDEVEMREIDGHFYYMKYPLATRPIAGPLRGPGLYATEGPGSRNDPAIEEFITVATTRPETFLGDTAVAVNPKDPQRAKFIGMQVRLPIVNRVIPIIGDDYVVIPDPDSDDPKAKYASGFLKVTPAHDPNDYEIGQRHGLPVINVMAPDGSICDFTSRDREGAGQDAPDPFLRELFGLDRYEARKAIMQWFKDHSLLEDIKPYRHSVGHSYRSHVPIEPYLSDQWYVKVTDERLSGAALRAMAREQYDASTSRVATQPRSDLNEGPGSRSDPAIADDATGLRFYPARYAKTFQAWHENIRDWCISRQLWWGHRIPVWSTREGVMSPKRMLEVVRELKQRFPDRIAVRDFELDRPHAKGPGGEDLTPVELCIALGPDTEDLQEVIESYGLVQDPDVLDTWFSSGLWPISTLGWPDPTKFPKQFPDGDAPLNTWNPSDTLCTAREIITLWVSRMVMFNLFFRGCLPFRDVFIHAMIQDGEGQKMSKSLGNGVDPLDIIHSHGADAMRFTLTAMTTQTQDVRMPVDVVCPHCGAAFHPPTKTTPAGHIVAVPSVDCPQCKRKMVTSYGVASATAKPTDEVPAARNTSSKFDNGRNFANKVWNAARFVLTRIDSIAGSLRDPGLPPAPDRGRVATRLEPQLADRWILSRLARTVTEVDNALREYQFNQYAQSLYDFFWRDYCDWYVEAVKPEPPGSPSQRILLAVLDASVRMLHPVMPFITERLWEHLNAAVADRSLPGLNLAPDDLCVKAAWPAADDSLLDEEAERQFALAQEIITVIRNIRSQYNVPPRQVVNVRLKAAGEPAAALRESGSLLRTLAGVEVLEIGPQVQPAGESAAALVAGIELYVEGLIDPQAERQRLSKRMEELSRSIAALTGRLNNPGYSQKAPTHLVQQTRDQLAEAQRELETVESKLGAL